MMLLLIACLLVAQMGLPPATYVAVIVVWLIDVAFAGIRPPKGSTNYN